jgi:putative hydrolase of the HAD superfamily
VRGSVGAIYQQIAREFGVEAAASELDIAFVSSFRAAPACAFAGATAAEIPQLEYQWWRAIAQETFRSAGILAQFKDFEAFFAALYAHFATAEPWVLYPEVLPTLKYWQQQGIELGVLSNFDSRLYAVLSVLGLEAFFSSVTISSAVGVAKPDPAIFAIALEKHHCLAADAYHIGDSWREDVQAAQAAGLHNIWVKRRF